MKKDVQPWIPSALPFFFCGLAYYLISPAFVLQFLSSKNDLLFVATRFVDKNLFDLSYYLDVIVIFASFAVGYKFASSGVPAKNSVLDYGSFQTSSPRILGAIFYVLLAYFALSAIASGVGFFTGYDTYDISVLGPMSTFSFMSAWFVNYFSKKPINLLFLSLFIFSSTVLVGWGSRMFFVLGFIALSLGVLSKNRQVLKSFWFYGAVAAFVLLVISIGIIREGDKEISAENLTAIFFAEPLFTSITAGLYLENAGGRPSYGVPYALGAALIHFIPSAVYPGKIDLINALTFDDNVESPFGARSLVVNLYSNFGYLYPIFVACFGSYYGFLRKRAKVSLFYRATYFSALPILLLLFFRDNLATVMKVTFFNGFLAPLLIASIVIWLSPRTLADIRLRIASGRPGNNRMPVKSSVSAPTR